MNKKIESIAELLHSEHLNGSQSRALEGTNKLSSLAESYDVQAVLNKLFQQNGRGDYVGYKVALTSKPIQELCGLDHPVFGRMFSSNLFVSPHKLQLSDFHHPGIEFELAVEFNQDLPNDQEFTAETIRPFISKIYPAFEIIEDRNADYSCLDVLTLAADNAWFGAAILGVAVALDSEFDIVNAKTKLFKNRELLGESVTGAALGNPLTSAALLVNHLTSRNQAVISGEKVITGSTFATLFPTQGDQFRYEIEGVGAVELEIN